MNHGATAAGSEPEQRRSSTLEGSWFEWCRCPYISRGRHEGETNWYSRRYDSTERRMTRQRTLVVQIESVAIEDGNLRPMPTR